MAMLAVFIYAQFVWCPVLNVLGCLCPGPVIIIITIIIIIIT